MAEAISAFRPGETVLASGAYWVSHSLHRVPHIAQLHKGDVFPECNWCGWRVQYAYESDSIRAEPIEKDVDFHVLTR